MTVEASSLYNPSYLGASGMHWWIGQIADDSTWRDNNVPGKFANSSAIRGHGYRYKVRIMGYHDQGEDVIPSEQLPWATVSLPPTAGGGQGSSFQTPNLRQGCIVWGHFIDGDQGQQPVITGIMPNNAQTPLANTIGDNRVTNEKPGSLATSGYAKGKKPPSGSAKPKAPDSDLKVTQPKPGETPTMESINNVHQISAADVKLQSEYEEPIALLKVDPEKKVPNAIKGLQLEIEKVTKKISKLVSQINSYVAALTGVLSNIQKLISDVACTIAKYLKILFDIIEERLKKSLNKQLTKVVSRLPMKYRTTFLKVKELLMQLITCMFQKLGAGLCALVAQLLNNDIGPESPVVRKAILQAKANPQPNNCANPTTARVPLCYAEQFAGRALAAGRKDIDAVVATVAQQVDLFLKDVSNQLGPQLSDESGISELIGGAGGGTTSTSSAASELIGEGIAAATTVGTVATTVGAVAGTVSAVAGGIAGAADALGGLSSGGGGGGLNFSGLGDFPGSMMSALSFINLSFNLFGCELTPNAHTSDKYSFEKGGAGGKEPNLFEAFAAAASDQFEQDTGISSIITPLTNANSASNEVDQDLFAPITQEESNAVQQGNVIDSKGNVIGSI